MTASAWITGSVSRMRSGATRHAARRSSSRERIMRGGEEAEAEAKWRDRSDSNRRSPAITPPTPHLQRSHAKGSKVASSARM